MPDPHDCPNRCGRKLGPLPAELVEMAADDTLMCDGDGGSCGGRVAVPRANKVGWRYCTQCDLGLCIGCLKKLQQKETAQKPAPKGAAAPQPPPSADAAAAEKAAAQKAAAAERKAAAEKAAADRAAAERKAAAAAEQAAADRAAAERKAAAEKASAEQKAAAAAAERRAAAEKAAAERRAAAERAAAEQRESAERAAADQKAAAERKAAAEKAAPERAAAEQREAAVAAERKAAAERAAAQNAAAPAAAAEQRVTAAREASALGASASTAAAPRPGAAPGAGAPPPPPPPALLSTLTKLAEAAAAVHAAAPNAAAAADRVVSARGLATDAALPATPQVASERGAEEHAPPPAAPPKRRRKVKRRALTAAPRLRVQHVPSQPPPLKHLYSVELHAHGLDFAVIPGEGMVGVGFRIGGAAGGWEMPTIVAEPLAPLLVDSRLRQLPLGSSARALFPCCRDAVRQHAPVMLHCVVFRQERCGKKEALASHSIRIGSDADPVACDVRAQDVWLQCAVSNACWGALKVSAAVRCVGEMPSQSAPRAPALGGNAQTGPEWVVPPRAEDVQVGMPGRALRRVLQEDVCEPMAAVRRAVSEGVDAAADPADCVEQAAIVKRLQISTAALLSALPH